MESYSEWQSPDHSKFSKAITGFQIITFLGLLLIMLRSPIFWVNWLAGDLEWQILPLLLISAAVIGWIAYDFSRRSSWFNPWLWKIWLFGILASPLLIVLLDSTPAHIGQNLTFLFCLLIGFIFLASREKMELLAVILLAWPLLILIVAFSYIYIYQFDSGLGPCRFFTQLQQAGCVRSIKPVTQSEVFTLFDPERETDHLLRPYGTVVWIEPLNRWQSLVGAEPIQFEHWVDYIKYRPADSRLQSINTFRVPLFGSQELLSLTKPLNYAILIEDQSIINLADGELLERFHLDLSTESNIEAAMEEWHKNQAEPASETTIFSANGRWLATRSPENLVTIRSTSPDDFKRPGNHAESNASTTIRPLPYWSFTPEINYDCLSLSPDGTWLAGYAGLRHDKVEIFNVQEKMLHASITVESETICPIFSPDGTLMAGVNTNDDQSIAVIDVETGQIIVQKPLPDFKIWSLAFTSGNRYLVAGGYPTSGSRFSESTWIIIDLEKFMRS